ncbi:MAG: DUF2971 domain-containing protein [Bacteroidetes bacterium]|nr:DUF2971 domain-containing protein [Bacteroidota bacterium]
MDKETYVANNRWQFSYQEDTGYSIIPSEPELQKLPETLFKYYSVSDNSLSALTEFYLYGSHPEQLNDPLDCSYELLKFDNASFIYNLMNHGNFSNPDYPMHQIEMEIECQKNNQYSHFIKSAKNLFKDLIFEKLGILSLTSSVKNELMWSYYSNHAGFCLEYDYYQFGLNAHGPFPINYSDDFSPISVNNNYTSVLYMTTLKTKSWKHEKEWRFLLESEQLMELPMVNRMKRSNSTTRKFRINPHALKSVTFGANFFNKEFEWETSLERPKAVTVKMDLKKFPLKLSEHLERIIDFSLKLGIPIYLMLLIPQQAQLYRCPIEIVKLARFNYEILLSPTCLNHENEEI